MIGTLILAAAMIATSPEACTGNRDAEVAPNTPVTLCWGIPPPDVDTPLLYFRLRQSQSQTGAYQQLVRITYDPNTMLVSLPDPCNPSVQVQWVKVEYTFTPKFTGHYFATAIYEVTENGVKVVKESVGSEHVRITVK